MAKKESTLRIGSFNWIESNIKSLFFSNDYDILVTSTTLIYLNPEEHRRFFIQVLPTIKCTLILVEMASLTEQVFESHFFAHPYENIFDTPLFSGFKIEKKRLDYEPWKSEGNYSAFVFTLTRIQNYFFPDFVFRNSLKVATPSVIKASPTPKNENRMLAITIFNSFLGFSGFLGIIGASRIVTIFLFSDS